MKEDEAQLWLSFGNGRAYEHPREAAVAMDMPFNRLAYLTESKWSREGVYEYGVVCDLGWKVQCNAADSKTLQAISVRGES